MFPPQSAIHLIYRYMHTYTHNAYCASYYFDYTIIISSFLILYLLSTFSQNSQRKEENKIMKQKNNERIRPKCQV